MVSPVLPMYTGTPVTALIDSCAYIREIEANAIRLPPGITLTELPGSLPILSNRFHSGCLVLVMHLLLVSLVYILLAKYMGS